MSNGVSKSISADSIAIVENGTTAVNEIFRGQYVIWKGRLHRAKSNIAIGGSLNTTTLELVDGGGFKDYDKLICLVGETQFNKGNKICDLPANWNELIVYVSHNSGTGSGRSYYPTYILRDVTQYHNKFIMGYSAGIVIVTVDTSLNTLTLTESKLSNNVYSPYIMVYYRK